MVNNYSVVHVSFVMGHVFYQRVRVKINYYSVESFVIGQCFHLIRVRVKVYNYSVVHVSFVKRQCFHLIR